MVVQALSKRRGAAALYVGESNVRRYFPRRISTIELQLGELEIDCRLPAEFWNGKPEICDPRLGEWLLCRVFHQRPHHEALPLSMTRLGKNAFRLQPITPSASHKTLSSSQRASENARELAHDMSEHIHLIAAPHVDSERVQIH